MILSKIQDSIAAYKKWLTGLRHHPHVHEWESLQIFQDRWTTDTADPAAMFDSCLHNSETRRLWQADQWQPMGQWTD